VVSDLGEVCGQEAARRALEVAAAGGHSLLLVGPSGLLPPSDDPDAPRPVRLPGARVDAEGGRP
jgi:hypothetical protein